jgi:hypothetical protein
LNSLTTLHSITIYLLVAVPPVQEAAIEAVIHLGETDDPKSIIEIVKSWKIENTYLSQHMRLVLKAFLKRHSDLCVV